MKFKLNGQEVQVEVSPIITETLDETLDSASVVLAANSIKDPIAPLQDFTIEFDNGDILEFKTASDQISVFSLDPLTYKHNLGLIQNTRILTHQVVKNSVFTQPANQYKEFSHNYTYLLGEPNRVDDVTYATLERESETSETITLSSNEKIKKVFYEVDAWVGIKEATDDDHAVMHKINSMAELKSLLEINDFPDQTVNLEWTYSHGNSNHTINLGRVSNFFTKIENNRMLEILSDPTNQFVSIEFDGNYPMFAWRFEPENTKAVSFIIYNIKIIIETYYYSIYDLLEMIVERQKQLRVGFSKDALFSLPTQESNPDLFNLLTNTIGPNFTFTQCTMFECLSEIFRLFDAVFTIKGPNKELGIEYLNERKDILPNLDLSGLNIGITENNRDNGFISFFQEAKIDQKFPSETGIAKVRSAELGVPAPNDHHFLVDKPISAVRKCEVLVSLIRMTRKYPTYSTITVSGDWLLDISRYVVNEKVWSELLTSDVFPYGGDYRNVVQNNSVFFSEGDNKIQIANTFKTNFGITYYALYRAVFCAFYAMMGSNRDFVNPNSPDVVTPNFKGDWNNIYFRLDYIATIDGRAKIESLNNKYNGDLVIDQSNGAVDLNKLGLNLLGVSMKTGEPTLNAKHAIVSWNDRIKKGQIFKDNDNEWVANSCSYEIIDENHIIGNISFVKNFNSLSSRIQLLREKRMSNISSDLIIKSEDNLIEYVYLSSTNFTQVENTGFSMDRTFLARAIKNTFSWGQSNIELDCSSAAKLESEIANQYVGIKIPMTKYGLGNCICFEMSYNHPMSAENNTSVTSGWFGSNKYFTKAAKYTNEDGFLDEITVHIFGYGAFDSYPIVGWAENNTVVKIENLKILKQPNEIFALNYELCFLPEKPNVDFVGSLFINNNYLITQTKIIKKFYLYYTHSDDSFQYSILDTKGYGDREEIISVDTETIQWLSNQLAIVFFFNDIYDIKTWSICDEEGNIYFASNNDSFKNTNKNFMRLYFSLSRTRNN